MRKLALVLFLIVILLTFPVKSENIAIGVSPSIVDLGLVERGSKELAKFHIISPSDETILVYLDTLRGTFNFFNRDDYRDLVHSYSEENVIPWLEILSNPVELKQAQDSDLLKGNIRTYRDIDLILNVPKNAEPGYHLLSVLPSPATKNQAEDQIGTQVVAVSPVRIIFQVPGEAVRKGKILDIQTGSRVGNRLEINIHFLNTGTVTLSAKADEISIKDEEGNLVEELTSSIEYVRPGEIKILKSYLPFENLEDGDYSVFANVDYNTGSTDLSSMITLESEKLEKMEIETQRMKSEFNWWLLIILVIIIPISVIIYRSVKNEG